MTNADEILPGFCSIYKTTYNSRWELRQHIEWQKTGPKKWKVYHKHWKVLVGFCNLSECGDWDVQIGGAVTSFPTIKDAYAFLLGASVAQSEIMKLEQKSKLN